MRISTGQIWANSLNNLMQAQQRENEANTQVSTQKVATDLAGYGSTSGVIAAYQSSLATTTGYLGVAQTVTDRLSSQDTALTTTSQSASDAKDSIMSALASNDGSTVMQSLQGAFSEALDGLNYEHNGSYLFAGGNDNTPPVSIGSMSQLSGSSVTVASVFTNGTVKKSSTIDSNTTLQTGMLASDLGTKLMQVFKDVQDYNDDPTTGPFANPLTDAQTTFLTTKAQEFSDAYSGLVNQTSLNGVMQKRVDNTTTSLQGQSDSLNQLITTRTSVDMSTAITDLQQAQVAVQASAQVLASLNSSSLLNLLK
ncbi:flagellin [Asticcacaulis sp. EMRT-3]|uniref:flagellin n=1 Tax=Asticcacaulis sp. EMRT-3 TaxID=3040349 RepID=UPI0024AECBAD|nr:flagellin [Asticcacaulis sp. EMRT-3]MDI7775495.1 flagellin [Asticcacaulis sp. EMRT-3]